MNNGIMFLTRLPRTTWMNSWSLLSDPLQTLPKHYEMNNRQRMHISLHQIIPKYAKHPKQLLRKHHKNLDQTQFPLENHGKNHQPTTIPAARWPSQWQHQLRWPLEPMTSPHWSRPSPTRRCRRRRFASRPWTRPKSSATATAGRGAGRWSEWLGDNR